MLQTLKSRCDSCTRCSLSQGTTQSVIYRGNPINPKIVLIGEGPGFHEQEQGKPFVGIAGQLLQRALDKMSLTEDDYHLCNIVKHRTPDNRPPSEEEIVACRSYLAEQIVFLQPKVIVLLGATALKACYETGPLKQNFNHKASISKLRGQKINIEFFISNVEDMSLGTIHSFKAIPCWHPSYINRLQGSDKGKEIKQHFWDDLNKAWELAK